MKKRKPVTVRMGGVTVIMSPDYKGYCIPECMLGWGHGGACVVGDKPKKEPKR